MSMKKTPGENLHLMEK